MKYRILIIEDDEKIRKELKTLLAGNGYLVSAAAGAGSGGEAVFRAGSAADSGNIVQMVKETEPHLILLDIGLPGESGFSLCSRIREFSDVPVIFVTAHNTDMDELNSIMTGGDAFITKPYNIAILLAKIASLLKRAFPDPEKEKRSERFSWKGAVLHPESSRLEYDGKSAELTKNEMKILYYLFSHAGAICSRADIVEYLWDNQLYVDDNALSVNVSRIREKLLAISLDGFIRTKHRQGYLI